MVWNWWSSGSCEGDIAKETLVSALKQMKEHPLIKSVTKWDLNYQNFTKENSGEHKFD